MAIVIEASNIASATGATSVTVPAITPAGSDRHVIGFGANSGGALSNYTDMTFGGNAMTPKVNQTNAPYMRTVAEELNAPAASSQSLVYTVASSQDELVAAVVALSGVSSATPTDTYQTGGADTADPISVSVTVDSGDLGIGWCYTISSTIASSDTLIREAEGVGGGVSANMAQSASPDTAMAWTRTGIGLNDWSAIAVNANASAGGGGGSTDGFHRIPESMNFKPLSGVY